ncbi:MAG TPA: heme o synthase [Vicinamibacterales bacterium]|nr:heme o synthase [Vicinamibacterales bacterium]
MKTDALSPPAEGDLAPAHTRLSDLLVLTKVRLNALAVATTAAGYYLGAPGPVDVVAMFIVCLGTALVASGAAALNQVDERDVDARMVRTRLRPVARGGMAPAEGRAIALALSAAGLLIVWLGSNVTAASLALATLAIYVFVYTPLKRRTSLATIVGAVPGALPPIIGWAAAGSIAAPGPWSLFLIMFIWQLPHFLAIAWMYRDDYAAAGLPMLPVVDTTGATTGRQAGLWAATLIPCSQLPFLFGISSRTYAIGALVLGLVQLGLAVSFAASRTRANARLLFYGSITYLPLLWALMAAGKP